jgi:two-component system sensor histidine kinase RegB
LPSASVFSPWAKEDAAVLDAAQQIGQAALGDHLAEAADADAGIAGAQLRGLAGEDHALRDHRVLVAAVADAQRVVVAHALRRLCLHRGVRVRASSTERAPEPDQCDQLPDPSRRHPRPPRAAALSGRRERRDAACCRTDRKSSSADPMRGDVAPPQQSASGPAAGSPADLVLRWLVPLRFLAAAAQLAALAAARFAFDLSLPYLALSAVPAATLLSNLALQRVRVPPSRALPLAAGVLAFDTLLFTLLLTLSGGPDNPFSAIYAIHVAMAAMLGSVRVTWLVAALSALGYAAAFLWHEPQHFWHRPVSEGSAIQLHAVGMWVAVALVAVALSYFVDRITRSLREREEALQRISLVAARNARLASLTTLAAGAAHELGSPLGTIAVVAGEIERGAARSLGDEGLAEDARLLRSEVERCRAILDRMSGRAAAFEREVAQPMRGDQVEAMLRAAEFGGAAARVDVAVEAPRDAQLGSLADFAAVVLPLVRNALDASTPEGRVRVRVACAAGWVHVEVSDQGHGMDAETLERAGEPFFTTRPPGRGTGLGLFVVRLHAERLGGTLRLTSASGNGTLASVEWPITDERS